MPWVVNLMNEQLHKIYKYFLEIVNQGSITLAAEKLYVSQPSLTKFIQRLENQLSIKLFDRSVLPIQLTPAGEIYRDYLIRVAALDMELTSKLAKLRTDNYCKIVFSCSPWRASLRIPVILSEFGKAYPNIEVALLEAPHQDICSMIEDGKADIGLTSSLSLDEGLAFHRLIKEPVFLVVNVDNPILAQVPIQYLPGDSIGYVNIRDFKNERFIVLRPNQMLRCFTEDLFKSNKLKPKLFETSSLNTAMGIVASGDGVSFLPAEGISTIRDINQFRFLYIGSPPLSWELGLLYSAHHGMSKHAEVFFHFVDNYYKQHPSADPG